MRRDVGGEVIAAIGAAALLTFAIAFGILLSVSDATEDEVPVTSTQQVVPDSDSNVDETVELSSSPTVTQVAAVAQNDAVFDQLTDLEVVATSAVSRLTENAPQENAVDQTSVAENTSEVQVTLSDLEIAATNAVARLTENPPSEQTSVSESTAEIQPTLSDLEIAATNAVARLTEVAEQRLQEQSTETAELTASVIPSETPTETATATDTEVSSETPTELPTLTLTPTSTVAPTEKTEASATDTDTPEPTSVPTEPPTATNTDVPTEAPTNTAIPTATPTITASPTSTATLTETSTETSTPSLTATETPSPTSTETPSPTATFTASPTDTATATATSTDTATPTETPTLTFTPSNTPTSTNTATATTTAIPRPTDNALGILPTEPAGSDGTGRESQATEPRETASNVDGTCGSPADWPVYVVQPGNTLFSIARAVGSTVSELRDANCISNVDNITTGDELYLPRLPDGPVQTGIPSVSTVSSTTVSDLEILGCESPLAVITDPLSGQNVTGVIPIGGTAFWGEFQYYKFEIRADTQTTYSFVARFDQPVSDGLIGVLDTSLFTPGLYWLRLVVVDQRGNVPQGATCAIPIVIG